MFVLPPLQVVWDAERGEGDPEAADQVGHKEEDHAAAEGLANAVALTGLRERCSKNTGIVVAFDKQHLLLLHLAAFIISLYDVSVERTKGRREEIWLRSAPTSKINFCAIL